MGVLLGFATGNLSSGNLARIQLLIETFEESYVPPSIHVFHNRKASICPVTINRNNHPMDDIPPPHPPPNHRFPPIPFHQQQPPPQPPYLPPWRRRIMRLPVPQRDPSRMPAPAACQELGRSMIMHHEPSAVKNSDKGPATASHITPKITSVEGQLSPVRMVRTGHHASVTFSVISTPSESKREESSTGGDEAIPQIKTKRTFKQ